MARRRQTTDKRGAKSASPEPSATAQREGARALERASRIIEVVSAADAAMTIADIERATELPKATAYRLTRQLVALEWLQVEPGSKRHSEGRRLRTIAWNGLNGSAVRATRRGMIAGLVDVLGETCFIGAPIDDRLQVMEAVASPRMLGVNIATGMRLPLHATAAGKLMIAQLPPRDRSGFLEGRHLAATASRTITETARLEAEFADILRKGYATEDHEHADGIVGVAVPIRAATGRALGCLALAAPSAHLTIDVARRHVPKMQDVADRLATTFGTT